MKQDNIWKWPLPNVEPKLPPDSGLFGAIRKYDIHTGIDLHCSEGQDVTAVEDGTVVSIIPFTGPEAESPWWLSTYAVMVEGKSGVVCYGEIKASVVVGQQVVSSELIGNVCRVLKNDKGKPTSMLHLELYSHGVKEPMWWHLNEEKPKQLKDPKRFLFKETPEEFAARADRLAARWKGVLEQLDDDGFKNDKV